MAAGRYQPTDTPNVYATAAKGKTNWYVRMPRNEKGTRPYVRCASEDDAKKLAARVHTLGEAAPDKTWTVRQVVDSWREQQAPTLKPRSVATYEPIIEQRILPEFGRRQVRSIRQADISAWLHSLKKQDKSGQPLSDGSKALCYAVLRALFAHALGHGALTVMPTLPYGKAPSNSSGRERFLTKEEENVLLAGIESSRRAWLAPMVEVALCQGLRLGEVCGLQWGDIDFEADTMTIRHNLGKDNVLATTKSTRGNTDQAEERTLGINERIRPMLLELHMAAGRKTEDYVFTNDTGGPRKQRIVQRAMRQAVERAGLAGEVSMHTLRHTTATRLANTPGVTVKAVSAFLGHKSLAVTEKYIHEDTNAEVVALMKVAI